MYEQFYFVLLYFRSTCILNFVYKIKYCISILEILMVVLFTAFDDTIDLLKWDNKIFNILYT